MEGAYEYQCKSPPARTSMYACTCEICSTEGENETGAEKKCKRFQRIWNHCDEVARLLSRCPDTTTMLVGHSKTKLTCHKALLGYYSEFFDAACYGGFKEAKTDTIELPEETFEGMIALISWIYSGTIETDLAAEHLWVLGDRLRSPEFCNAVMHVLFDTYGCPTSFGGQWMHAITADFIYRHTTEKSALRCYIKQLIMIDGPLCARAAIAQTNYEVFKKDWHSLILRGGEMVLDIAEHSSFSNDKSEDDPETPWKPENHHKYMVSTKGMRSIGDFLNGVKRG